MVETVKIHPAESFVPLSAEAHKEAQLQARKVWILGQKILGEGHLVRIPTHPEYLEMQLMGQDQLRPAEAKIMDFMVRLTTTEDYYDSDAPLPSENYLFLRTNGGTVVKETRHTYDEKVIREEVGKEDLIRLSDILKGSRSFQESMV